MRVGDTVILVDDSFLNTKIGAEGKIYKIDDSLFYVVWDKNTLSGEQMDGGYSKNRFVRYPSSFFPQSEPSGKAAPIDYLEITKSIVGR